MEKTQRTALNSFKFLMIAMILFNLLLRAASGHQFYLPLQELMGYSVIILSIILISVYPSIKEELQGLVKYATIFSLIGVLIFLLSLWEGQLSIDFEDWYIALLFYFFHAAMIGLTAFAIFLLLTNRGMKKESK